MDNSTPAPPPAPLQSPVAVTEDKTVAIVSYITLFGFIAAIIIHNGKKTRLGAFHLRQTLGFMIMGMGLYVCLMIIAFIPIVKMLTVIAIPVLGIALTVFWIMGLIAAVNGEMKPMPIVGPMYQKWFGTTFD